MAILVARWSRCHESGNPGRLPHVGSRMNETIFTPDLAGAVGEGDWALPVAEEASLPVVLVPVPVPTPSGGRGWAHRGARAMASATEWAFGALALGLGLAVLAA